MSGLRAVAVWLMIVIAESIPSSKTTKQTLLAVSVERKNVINRLKTVKFGEGYSGIA